MDSSRSSGSDNSSDEEDHGTARRSTAMQQLRELESCDYLLPTWKERRAGELIKLVKSAGYDRSRDLDVVRALSVTRLDPPSSEAIAEVLTKNDGIDRLKALTMLYEAHHGNKKIAGLDVFPSRVILGYIEVTDTDPSIVLKRFVSEYPIYNRTLTHFLTQFGIEENKALSESGGFVSKLKQERAALTKAFKEEPSFLARILRREDDRNRGAEHSVSIFGK